MVPVVALVGRPNVGKSTLFNRLTRTRDALVADFPGLTRDRKYGRAEIEGREFICIDTGGIDGTEDGVETRMAEQSLLAIEEADVVLFMVDARAGLMPADEAIAKHLRSREKPTFLVANKTDGLDPDQAVVDFYSLGLGEIYPIAASHGRGVLSLLEHVLLPWMEDLAPQEEVDEDAEYWAQFEAEENGEEEEEDDFDPQSLPIKLAIVGRPNVGKSTLTNRILGEERVVVYDMPGTTRDSIYIPMERDGREYVLIDTAGVRKRGKITDAVEKFSVIKTLQAIEDANADALTKAEANTTVEVTLSSGKGEVSVPSVTGMDETTAYNTLTNSGFTPVKDYAYSADVAQGNVIEQSPNAGSLAKSGDNVKIVISRGEEQAEATSVAVPGVTGLTEDAARSAIQNVGLAVGNVSSAYSDSVASGQIISQSPVADTAVDAGTAVDFVVSMGAEPAQEVTPTTYKINLNIKKPNNESVAAANIYLYDGADGTGNILEQWTNQSISLFGEEGLSISKSGMLASSGSLKIDWLGADGQQLGSSQIVSPISFKAE